MGLHLYEQATSDTQASSGSKTLRLLCGYENGSVVLRQYNRIGREASVEGQGWDVIWKAKAHADTSKFFDKFELLPPFMSSDSYFIHTVMAMRVSRGNTFALSVSADHIVGRYDLTVRNILFLLSRRAQRV
jgi:hypothetical protein